MWLLLTNNLNPTATNTAHKAKIIANLFNKPILFLVNSNHTVKIVTTSKLINLIK